MARINAVSRALRSVRGEASVDLDNLFSVPAGAVPNTEVFKDALLIKWDALERNEAQPRQTFDEAALQELADSIKQDGQLQPILVRPHPADDSKYQIVMGERRWRACGPEYADLPFVRAVVRRNVSDEDAFRLALIENVMREDLNDVDKAKGLVALKASMQKINTRVKWSDVATSLGYTPVHISRLVSMLRLPPDVQEEVRQGTVSSRQARVLAKERDPERRSDLFAQAKAGVSSDALEKQVSGISINRTILTPADPKTTPGQHLLNLRRAVEFVRAAGESDLNEWSDEERAGRQVTSEELGEALKVL